MDYSRWDAGRASRIVFSVYDLPKAGEAYPMAISCSMHDQLESAATLRKPCRIDYVDEHGSEYSMVAVPLDWWVGIGVEWGRFRTEDGEEVVLNLSDIVSIESLP